MNQRFKILRYFIIFIFSDISLFLTGQVETITSYKSPEASGSLILKVRNDTLRYSCDRIPIIKGTAAPCDSNPYIKYEFFINRDAINENWSNKLIRVYDYWIDASKSEVKGPWINIEKNSTISYKEDYTDQNQKSGITYKHHETRKNLIGYILANPKGKLYQNKDEFQFQYDWEENIKGRYEAFYLNGIKKFRHNYEVNRIMSLDKTISGKTKYSIDVQITGVIQAYYANGKKKSVVNYTERIVSEKLLEDTDSKLKTSSKVGEKLVYWESGKLYSKGGFNIHGEQGKIEYYGPKGLVITKIENYKDGVLNGKYYEYYLDGKLKAKGEYKEGELVGEIKFFDEDGTKIKKEN